MKKNEKTFKNMYDTVQIYSKKKGKLRKNVNPSLEIWTMGMNSQVITENIQMTKNICKCIQTPG